MEATSKQRSQLADAIEALNEMAAAGVDLPSLARDLDFTFDEIWEAKVFLTEVAINHNHNLKKEETGNGQS